MRHTVFETPLFMEPLHWASVRLLRLFGWRTAGEPPDIPRYVLIGGPHTSNWDFVVMLAVVFTHRMSVRWMGKKVIFRWPFGAFFRWLGGISIDRTRSTGVVAQFIEAFRNSTHLVLLITPEGTRKRTERWKSGFYHIAKGAGVPIVLGYVDYPVKVAGFGSVVHPTGDIETDMEQMQAFYADKTGKYPEQSAQNRPPEVSTP